MATLVLSAVGTAIGGPVGGAIGALLGQAADQNILFKPKEREGPRLSDLSVQTSTYGSQVPRIFGAMRVAGTVIWASDLKETKTKSGGKGKPTVTTYSYSASFAVALSSRPVLRVGRIWADGNLLRGAAGDFKTQLGAFRLYPGDPDQGADQLIAAAQGAGVTPAHRGMAYALFEDLQLADYGNRIPSLTFEVIADEGEIGVAAIARAVTGGLVTGAGGEGASGFAASGGSMADALEPLLAAYGLRLSPGGGGLVLDGSLAAAGSIAADALAGRVNGRAVVPAMASRDAAAQTPQSLSIRHYDPARDYQAGLQRAVRPGPGRSQAQIDLPAVMSAARAKQLAAARIARLWKGRSRMELACGWPQLALVPGSVVAVAGAPGLWSIEERQWEAMAVKLKLRQVASAPPPDLPAASGDGVSQPDLAAGATTLLLADLPPLGDNAASVPVLVAAAAGASAGWRSAALLVETGDESAPIGRTAPRATMGSCLSVPGGGQALLFDAAAAFEVELLADDMALAGASDAALLRGANLCLAGGELLQFGRAEQTGARRFRLTRLLRGRRGTEWAMAGHVAGEPFLMIDADTLAGIADEYVRMGDRLSLLAVGVGDTSPAEASIMVEGNALRPPAPVHMRIAMDGAGNRTVGWTRRSRTGWAWVDHVDAPLGEEQERYRFRVLAGERVLRSVEVESPSHAYGADMAAADAAAAGSGALTLEVVQIGARATSRPLRRTITV